MRPLPSDVEIETLLAFLTLSGDLKDTLRSGYTNAGAQENTAAHSWRLCLWVIALEPFLDGLDMARLLKLAILHDLGEAVTGDVPAIHQSGDQSDRKQAEAKAIIDMTADLRVETRTAIRSLADEYETGASLEAAMVKGLDKLETMHQHATGTNPPDFDYAFNLSYGEKWTKSDPLLLVLRAAVDRMTKARDESSSPP
ncbi:MAG: HD domain-containing protein [Pseudomonadota bacterium]